MRPSLPKPRAKSLITSLVLLNVAAWAATLIVSHRTSTLWGKAFLAYGFGLRHAVDADHISAIDNTTRRLSDQENPPIAIGLYFALGHSTVVVFLSAALAISSGYVLRHMPIWQERGAIIGTLVSTAFLYVIGTINLIVLFGLWRNFRRSRMGGTVQESGGPAGLIGTLLKPILGAVRHSWQMYLVGFLFGLGFDTATEVGILAMSVRSGQVGMPFWIIMLLPFLFTAAMCLVDTLDGIFMAGAYGWAYVDPVRKLSYNAGITAISVVVAFGVGTSELLQLLSARGWLSGPWVSTLQFVDRMHPGYYIVAAFAAFWLAALLGDSRRRSTEMQQ